MTFLLFYLDGCSHCEEAKKMLSKFKELTYIEANSGNPLLEELNITKFPTLVIQGDSAGDPIKYEGVHEIKLILDQYD